MSKTKVKKKKKLKGIASFKEACMQAREACLAVTYGGKWYHVDIYLESDGSFSLNTPHDKKAKYYCSIDRSGARTQKVYRRSQYCSSVKVPTYLPLKKSN